jgi:hypothetical protein
VNHRNSLALELEINPKLPALTVENIQKYSILKIIGIKLYNESKTVFDGQIIQATYDYNETIDGKQANLTFEIAFSQKGLPSCIIKAAKNLTILTKAKNNLPFMFYT